MKDFHILSEYIRKIVNLKETARKYQFAPRKYQLRRG